MQRELVEHLLELYLKQKLLLLLLDLLLNPIPNLANTLVIPDIATCSHDMEFEYPT